MPLTSEDVELIGKLFDQRMAAYDRRQNAGRRFWRWFWIVLFVVSSIASWYFFKGIVGNFESQITTSEAAIDQQMAAMRQSYQRELAQDKQMQQDRAVAAAASHYQSGQSQGDFDAGLMRQAIQLMAKAQQAKSQANAKAQSPNAGGDDDDLAQLQSLTDATDGAANIMMQLLLHESDPAANNAAQSEAQKAAQNAAMHDSHPQTPPVEQAMPLQGAGPPGPGPAGQAPGGQAPAPGQPFAPGQPGAPGQVQGGGVQTTVTNEAAPLTTVPADAPAAPPKH
jgi:hypothetical protein